MRIVDQSPLVVPIDRLAEGVSREQLLTSLRRILAVYCDSLPTERRMLLDQFALADLARKVVGVGSVGNESWIALLVGPVGNEPLFLQLKEPSARCSRTSPARARSPTTASGSSSGSG